MTVLRFYCQLLYRLYQKLAVKNANGAHVTGMLQLTNACWLQRSKSQSQTAEMLQPL